MRVKSNSTDITICGPKKKKRKESHFLDLWEEPLVKLFCLPNCPALLEPPIISFISKMALGSGGSLSLSFAAILAAFLAADLDIGAVGLGVTTVIC